MNYLRFFEFPDVGLQRGRADQGSVDEGLDLVRRFVSDGVCDHLHGRERWKSFAEDGVGRQSNLRVLLIIH